MRKPWISVLALTALVTLGSFSSGCALFLVGAGAAGGYGAIGEDELEGMMDKPYDKVWKASEEVVRKQGLTTLALKDQGKIEGEIEGSKVELHIDQVTPKTVRLRVKARKVKNLFPDLKRAEKVYNLILREVD
jgi:hypothetical protein